MNELKPMYKQNCDWLKKEALHTYITPSLNISNFSISSVSLFKCSFFSIISSAAKLGPSKTSLTSLLLST